MNTKLWAVVVAQLVERLLPNQRSAVRIQSLVNLKYYICLLSTVFKNLNKEKRRRDWPIFRNNPTLDHILKLLSLTNFGRLCFILAFNIKLGHYRPHFLCFFTIKMCSVKLPLQGFKL